MPGLDEAVNALEFFIHHEDVRRAQRVGAPRAPRRAGGRLLEAPADGPGLFLRKSPVAVVLHRIGGGVAIGGAEDAPRVEVTGPASELLLFCFGRQAQARVDLSGDEAAVARLMDASLGA
nr:hypothetical protein GCM10020093_115770 [Planobispora longispora]